MYGPGGELEYIGDLSTGGALSYIHDVLYIALFAQLAGCLTDYAWLACLLVRACLRPGLRGGTGLGWTSLGWAREALPCLQRTALWLVSSPLPPLPTAAASRAEPPHVDLQALLLWMLCMLCRSPATLPMPWPSMCSSPTGSSRGCPRTCQRRVSRRRCGCGGAGERGVLGVGVCRAGHGGGMLARVCRYMRPGGAAARRLTAWRLPLRACVLQRRSRSGERRGRGRRRGPPSLGAGADRQAALLAVPGGNAASAANQFCTRCCALHFCKKRHECATRPMLKAQPRWQQERAVAPSRRRLATPLLRCCCRARACLGDAEPGVGELAAHLVHQPGAHGAPAIGMAVLHCIHMHPHLHALFPRPPCGPHALREHWW